MNPDKSELIIFCKGFQTKELHVGGQPKSTKIKLLGVTVEKGYHSEAHSNQVSLIHQDQFREDLYEMLKTRVTESIMISSLSYCLSVWGF